MATKAETKEITAEELVAVLKFTPRTYKISMWGYGGEKVMGTVERAVWDYCMDNQVDLSEIAWSDEDTVQDEMDLDVDRLPFPPGSWYECDDMAHTSGVSRNAGTLQIEDENGEVVFERSLEDCDGGEDSPEWSCFDEVWIGSKPAGTVVFVGCSNEKGTFFEGEIELTAPFDITKLTLSYDEIDGEELVNGVTYDGEDIDNFGGSTDGKSSDFGMYLVKDSNSWETYSPEEKDWGHPPYGTSPSTWERSETFKFKKVKPTIPGYYSCTWQHFGTTYGSAYWDGTEFGEWEYGQFKPITGEVLTWSGYNWDTSSWVNQPPEPPNLTCDDKSCGWIGKSEERIEDAEYNDHCPKCNGTDFSWIDYDPDTKQGRANRKQFCKPWDPGIALERIIVPEPTEAEKAECIAGLDAALAELAKESGIDFATEDDVDDCNCKHCGWVGSMGDITFRDGEFYCPDCGEMFVPPKDDVEDLPAKKTASPASWPF